MDIQKILTADYLDILFDNRNKTYGGYALRRSYPKYALRAVGSLLLSVGVLVAYPVIAGSFKKDKLPEIVTSQPVDLSPIEQHKPDVPLPVPPKPEGGSPQKNVKTMKVTPPIIAANVDDKDLLRPNDEIAKAVISTENHDGDLAAEGESIIPPGKGGDGFGPDKGPGKFTESPKKNEPAEWVEQMPEFNGDMRKYLQDHIHYPQSAIENGVNGKVLVRFTVGEDGSIYDAKVVRSIGGGCDEEALRVVKSMPKWKPGKQNGQPVKVYFTLPIIFHFE